MSDIFLLSIGALVGAINAIAGGGMLIGFPVLLATGMPAIAANATSYLAVTPGNIAANIGYRRYLRKIPKRYLLLLIPAIVGTSLGTYILRNTSYESFDSFIPWLILFAVTLFAVQPFLYKYVHKHVHGPLALRKKIKPLLIVGIATLPLATYGGYFGAGFGFIMLSFLGFTGLRDHVHRMNALKNLLVIVVSSTALIMLLDSGLIQWREGLIMGAGNLAGGYYGAIMSQKISGKTIRIAIVAIGFVTALYLGLRSY